MGVNGAPKTTALIYCCCCQPVYFCTGEITSTDLALEDAETALENVHDGIVDSLPLVDDLVIMDTNHDVGGGIVLALALALIHGLLRVPALRPRELLLLEKHPSEELDVAAGEEVVSAIDVDDALAGPGSRSLDQLAEDALFLLAVLSLGFPRGLPLPDVDAGGLARLVSGVELHTLQHGLALGDSLLLGAVALLTGELLLEGLDEVRPGAQQHAADQVGGGDAGGALDDLEATRLLDEAVAVVAVAVRGDVVAVDDVLAAVVGDIGE